MEKPHIKKHTYGKYWYCAFRGAHGNDTPGRGPTPWAALQDWIKKNRFTAQHQIHTVTRVVGGIQKCDCGYTF